MRNRTDIVGDLQAGSHSTNNEELMDTYRATHSRICPLPSQKWSACEPSPMAHAEDGLSHTRNAAEIHRFPDSGNGLLRLGKVRFSTWPPEYALI
ncbi:hypothetical protein HUJ05_000543 [Dendroctonus ponderosae]|nr:hypothetical protein HUJ05_000543 [Dendroctonus ponderosae]